MERKLELNDIAYCGLNCRLCNLTTILPAAALSLREIMQADGWEHFGSQIYPEFETFWKVLYSLAGMKEHCPMCKGSCGNPECVFRICAREKGLQLCAECSEYPCQPLREFFSGHYLKLAVNNERIREIGIEAWLEEQQKLVDAETLVASFIPVSTGITDGDFTEIVEPRIRGKVIVLGQDQLQDGADPPSPWNRSPRWMIPGPR